MSTTIFPGSQQIWTCSGAPSSTIVLGQGGTLNFGDIIIDSNTSYEYITTSTGTFDPVLQTYTGCTFNNVIFNANILTSIASSGWNINTSRSYIQRSSPAFNTSYTPNTTNDVMVSCVINVTSTLLTPGTVLFEINPGSGFVTIGEASASGVAASIFQTITHLIPANSQYKLVNSSGTASIISIYELTM